jgi:hypothetical protein
MRAYTVFINEQTLAGLLQSGMNRERVMKFIRSLANNPNTPGDFSEQDNSGRAVQVKVIARYAVTFWADHAVSEIKVTHIKPADGL